MISRRTFLDGLATGVAGAAISSTAKSYAQIMGANGKPNFAILGLNGRGYAHLSALKNNGQSARVSHVCDVDSTILAKFADRANKELGYAPAADGDYRKVLASKDVDDTLTTSFNYPDKMLTWEGRSCQGMREYGRERGSVIMGTKGSVLVDRDGYETYDWNGKKTDEFKTGHQTSSSDLLGRDSMTDLHFGNLIDGIRNGAKLNSPIPVGNVTVTMLQLSNIAWTVNRELKLDTQNGHIQGDAEAMKMWARPYEKGWEVHV